MAWYDCGRADTRSAFSAGVSSSLGIRWQVVGRSFGYANQVTVFGRPISIVVIAER
jgi:hypothetical protein